MRFLGSKLLLSGVVASLAVACSQGEQPVEELNVENLTDNDLAREALKIMGAPQVPRGPGEQASCSFTGCHSINSVTLRQWDEQSKAVTTYLAGRHSKKEKINFFRQNPSDERTNFTPERIGIMAAGAHLALGANVSEQRHPEAFKQGKQLATIFKDNDELYASFRKEMLMPVLPEYPRLTATQYEVILTWFKKGMPNLKDYLNEDERPKVCTDDFEKLRARTVAAKASNWAAANKEQRIPMLGCASTEVSPTECFKQHAVGKEGDAFASSVDTEFAKGWAAEGSVVRVLREFSSPNSFWLRSSADGRFVATGGGRNGGAQAIDLKATLEGQSRDIGLDAAYDPDFWPDNKAFMFQGGTKFCAQSLLEKPSTTLVTFGEPECSSLSAASGLYQTVGQRLGDNSISDRFILYSVWAGDSGQYTAEARDTEPRAGADSGINIYTAVALGNDVEAGYKIQGEAAKLTTPYRGDTMMARSGKMLGSRIAYERPENEDAPKLSGYRIEALDSTVDASGKFSFQLSELGTVCMKGNKANFSFDERFLATHHYNEPADFAETDDPAYKEKGSADIHVVDLFTGKKVRVTKMGPGQFALYPHFRSDGWLYFLVVDHSTEKYHTAASDWAVREGEANPTR